MDDDYLPLRLREIPDWIENEFQENFLPGEKKDLITRDPKCKVITPKQIKELAKKIALSSGFKGKILWDRNKPDGTPKKQLNIEKIKKLGWEPQIKLDEGIKDTLELFRSKI